MYHFFVSRDQIGDQEITITGPDVNHIRNVLRMRTGEQVLISDGVEKDYLCSIGELGADSVMADIICIEEVTTELPAKLVLFQGLPKGDKMELIIQKAVELGVYKIIPVETRRTVVKLDAKKEESRVKRWNAVSESAAKQSKRVIIPEVTGILSFKEAVRSAGSYDMNVIPFEHASGMEHTKEVLAGMKTGMTMGIFIGPEGGFDDSEVAYAAEQGVHEITLGKRILRTETAGMALLSVLMFQLDRD